MRSGQHFFFLSLVDHTTRGTFCRAFEERSFFLELAFANYAGIKRQLLAEGTFFRVSLSFMQLCKSCRNSCEGLVPPPPDTTSSQNQAPESKQAIKATKVLF
jgi:hypothetical protein